MNTATAPTLKCEVSVPGCADGAPLRNTVEGLLSLLSGYALDPRFEEYGDFIHACRHGVEVYDASRFVVRYEDGGPIYPEHPSAVRFWGNFYALSAVFCIDTDDAELIALLTKAIRDNQASPAYLQAKQEIGGEKWHQSIARGLERAGKRTSLAATRKGE